MARRFDDWLQAYVNYASFGEAPPRMNFWSGVSAVAGALRRKVWIDQHYFQWYANLYIVFVAPPGIVSKSTTADTAMSLLREVKGVRFGPAVVTWQALVTNFAEAAEQFPDEHGVMHTMSPITIVSSEFGNLINPRDQEMIDILVHLWDGRPFTKATKGQGTEEIVNPWINIIAATTPEWIAANMPEYMVGGGFTSRCLFVYASEKARYVPYPGLVVPNDMAGTRAALIEDLQHISEKLVGEYSLSKEAVEWGSQWYERHYREDSKMMDPSRFGGYVARKQALAHKTAMVLAASQRDEMVITKEDLETAVSMLTDLEPDMKFVFDKIGMTPEAAQSERLSALLAKKGTITYMEMHSWAKRYFPHKTSIEDIFAAGVASGHYWLDASVDPPLVRFGVRPVGA